MSVIELSVNSETNQNKGGSIWGGSETLSVPGTGDTFILPDGIGKIEWIMIHIIIDVLNSRGIIELSISDRDDLKAGNGNFFEWEDGEVGADTRRSYPQISAIRMVNVQGTTTLEIKAV